MKRSFQLITLAAVLTCALGILFSACKKEEIPGPKGEAGTNGVGGNANITSTNTFVVNVAQWTPDSANFMQTLTLSFPELTQTVVDKGGVKVYKQTGTTWAELPLVYGDLFTQYGFDVGHLYLQYINIEGGSTPLAPATARYRMVIVSEI
jgi:hypothetical protein